MVLPLVWHQEFHDYELQIQDGVFGRAERDYLLPGYPGDATNGSFTRDPTPLLL